MARSAVKIVVSWALFSCATATCFSSSDADAIPNAAITADGRGFVSFTSEASGKTRILEVDGPRILAEWTLTDFRVRTLDLARARTAEADTVVVRGVPSGDEPPDHFLTRVYARAPSGELELKWTSGDLADDLRQAATIGISADARFWVAAREIGRDVSLAVGDIAGLEPAWRWTDPRTDFAQGAEGVWVDFLDSEANRVLLARNRTIAVVDAAKGIEALPQPARCAGGIASPRLGLGALWARCYSPANLDQERLLALSPSERRVAIQKAINAQEENLFVVYPLDALDTPIVFDADSYFPGEPNTLWITDAGAAIVNGVTGEVRGLALDTGRRRVVESGQFGTLDRRFVSGKAPSFAPFLDVGSRSGSLVELDARGGIAAFTSLTRLNAEDDQG